jgi:hypothetical protein
MLVFSTQLCELLPLYCKLISGSTLVCKGGGGGVLGLRQIKTCRKVPLQFNFYYEPYLATYETLARKQLTPEQRHQPPHLQFHQRTLTHNHFLIHGGRFYLRLLDLALFYLFVLAM